ncbi:unnamed protein product, partial [marine sediment metagenome]
PSYGATECRRNVCFHHPNVMESFKATIRRAIEEIKVDALHFDGYGFGNTEGVDACRCDRCRADFTEFLKLRYGNNLALAKERFGHTNLDAIEAPGMIAFPRIPTGAIRLPDWQEWISFRCTWTAMFARQISDYVYELNPDVAIIANNGAAVKENIALMHGMEFSTVAETVDMVFCEDAYGPEITAEGRILQRFRQMHLIHESKTWIITYADRGGDDAKTLWRNMAHDAALNHGRVPHIGFTPYLYYDFHQNFETKKKFLS